MHLRHPPPDAVFSAALCCRDCGKRWFWNLHILAWTKTTYRWLKGPDIHAKHSASFRKVNSWLSMEHSCSSLFDLPLIIWHLEKVTMLFPVIAILQYKPVIVVPCLPHSCTCASPIPTYCHSGSSCSSKHNHSLSNPKGHSFKVRSRSFKRIRGISLFLLREWFISGTHCGWWWKQIRLLPLRNI